MDRSDNTVTGVYMDKRQEKRGRKEWREEVEEGTGYTYYHTYQQMKVLLSTEVWNI